MHWPRRVRPAGAFTGDRPAHLSNGDESPDKPSVGRYLHWWLNLLRASRTPSAGPVEQSTRDRWPAREHGDGARCPLASYPSAGGSRGQRRGLGRSRAHAGRLRLASRPPRARLGSTSMRSAPGRDGIVTSRWPCWPMLIWPLCVSTPSGGEDLDLAADLLPLTVPEVRRLLWHLVWARPPDPGRILAWSNWRRRHQQRARRSHWTRRTRTHQPRL